MTGFDPWGPISGLLFELGSDDVQRIIECSGLTPDWTLSEVEARTHVTRKRVFRGRVSKLYQNLYSDTKQIFIVNVAREIIETKPEYCERINRYLQNIGWSLVEERIIPILVIDPSEIVNLPQSAREDLSKAAERFQNDPSGAITSACGAVETLCKEIYGKYSLGAVESASFQEKVNNSLSAVKALERLKDELVQLGWSEEKANILSKNLKGTVSQAAYVMQAIRSDMGDVHGSKPALDILAFDSIKWSMIISSLLRE